MRAVVQRVSRSKVSVDEQKVGAIDRGLMVLLGVQKEDQRQDAEYLAEKVAGLRVFEDDAGKMNLSVLDIGGGILVVSQFTLLGDVRKGKRPSFVDAADPDRGNELYEYFVDLLKQTHISVATGKFRANMQVEIVNDGPVTILLDSQKKF